MTTITKLLAEDYLKARRVRFETMPHEGTESALEEAAVLRLPAADVLKAVLLRVRDGYCLAVLPASRRIDLHAVRNVTSDPHARLATEAEVREAYPQFELGALPPLPGLLSVKAYVDPRVFVHDECAFADGLRTGSVIAPTRELFWGEEVWVEPISKEADWYIEGDSIRVEGSG